MPILENGPVKIHYEGSRFRLSASRTARRRLRGDDCWSRQRIQSARRVLRYPPCGGARLRNANNGSSEGPLDIERNWDAFTDDQLALADHLGFDKFLVIGFRIGGPMIWNLLKRAIGPGCVGIRAAICLSSHPEYLL